MTLLKSLFLVLTVVLSTSCTGKKAVADATDNETETNQTMETQKMIDAGFLRASIVASDVEGDCPFTMSVEDNNVLLDPINLDESYKKQGKKIWVKYTGLRMMNRCEKANPVRIEEIQKREE